MTQPKTDSIRFQILYFKGWPNVMDSSVVDLVDIQGKNEETKGLGWMEWEMEMSASSKLSTQLQQSQVLRMNGRGCLQAISGVLAL